MVFKRCVIDTDVPLDENTKKPQKHLLTVFSDRLHTCCKNGIKIEIHSI